MIYRMRMVHHTANCGGTRRGIHGTPCRGRCSALRTAIIELLTGPGSAESSASRSMASSAKNDASNASSASSTSAAGGCCGAGAGAR